MLEGVDQSEPVRVHESVLTDAFAQKISEQTLSLPDYLPVLALLGYTKADLKNKKSTERHFIEWKIPLLPEFVDEWEARLKSTPEWRAFLEKQATNRRTGLALSVKGLHRRGYDALADIRGKSVGELTRPGPSYLTPHAATFWKKALGPTTNQTPIV